VSVYELRSGARIVGFRSRDAVRQITEFRIDIYTDQIQRFIELTLDMVLIYTLPCQIQHYSKKEPSILESRFIIIFHLELKIYLMKRNNLDQFYKNLLVRNSFYSLNEYFACNLAKDHGSL
jgi:hypothetical protein